MTTAAALEIELPALSDPQLAILEADERCVDAEGAIRSGKSTAAGLKCWVYALMYPGVHQLACRWKQQDVDGQLRALWRQVGAWFPVHLHPRWNAQEECYEFPEVDGKVSRVYMKSLKASEETGRYSKFRGLTLARVWIEQAEEVPEDVYVELKGRLSQPGYDKQILLTPNPVDEDHWIAAHFPADGDRANHRYVTSDVYSNRAILGDEVISGFEQDYPEGHPKRLTLIHGKRGVNVIGKPVYEGYFSLALVKPVAFDPEFELLEGWDFGHAYPAVTFAQYFPHQDRLHVLGFVQGRDMFLEEFAPHALAIRDEWFPDALVRSWGDPSGDTGNQGIKQTAMSTLRDGFDVNVQVAEKANDPAVRDMAIQAISARMFRRRFALNPRGIELVRDHGRLERRVSRLIVSAFATGYVWDERKNVRANPNVRSPKKGTRYDHTMNDLEYIVVGEKIPAKPKATDLKRARQEHRSALQQVFRDRKQQELDQLRRQQQDDEDDDLPLIAQRHGGFRRRVG